jgi:esterase
MLYSKIEGEGFPILIIHGFLGMSDNWKSIATQFANEGFQTHALDLRNHGKSFHSSDFSYEIMVQDVVDYCEFHHLSEIIVLGHSMGGKVAMLLATKYPDLVKLLLVADIGPKYYAPHHQTILAALNAVDFSSKPSRKNVEEILQNYISDFGTRQFLLKNLYWKTPEQLDFRFNLPVFNQKIGIIGTELPSENKFIKPTIFLRGALSNYILDTDFETIFAHFPMAKMVTIPNAGHWLHAENPKEFFDNALRFIMENAK